MKYLSFAIKDFKGINHLELDLASHPQGSVFPLVGLNESGKTTILEALDYLQLGIGEFGPLDILGVGRDDPHDLMPIAKRGNFNGQIEISVSVELDDNDIADLKRFLSKHDFKVQELSRSLTITDQYDFEGSTFQRRRGRWIIDCRGTVGRQRTVRSLTYHTTIFRETAQFLRARMPGIWYFPNFLFDFPRRIYLDESEPKDAKETFYRGLLEEVLAAVDPTASLEQHIAQRISSDNQPDKTALNQLLLQVGRQITSDVFESWNEIFQRRSPTEAKVTPGIADDDRRYLELSIVGNDGLYYIDERSLGFRWFFVFSLITKYKRNNPPNSQGIVYLFDEPASNLHAGAQSQLLNSLERLSSDCTIIYTTHSHHLINPNWLENTYVVVNKGFDYDDAIEYVPTGTDVTIERYRSFAAKHPDQTRYFQPILDVLDYRPSRLEMIDDVVMVEGKNDFYTLEYIRKVIGIGKSIDVQLVPGNGAGSLDTVIRLYLGWAKDFVVLLDSDKEGENQKKRYLDVFGPIVRDRLFSLGDICADLKGKKLEGAFQEQERRDMVAAVYGTGNNSKKQFNRSIQECLVTEHSIPLSPTTKNTFSDILEQLQAKLKTVKL